MCKPASSSYTEGGSCIPGHLDGQMRSKWINSFMRKDGWMGSKWINSFRRMGWRNVLYISWRHRAFENTKGRGGGSDDSFLNLRSATQLVFCCPAGKLENLGKIWFVSKPSWTEVYLLNLCQKRAGQRWTDLICVKTELDRGGRM